MELCLPGTCRTAMVLLVCLFSAVGCKRVWGQEPTSNVTEPTQVEYGPTLNESQPGFAEPMSNVTAMAGRDAVLSCAVDHLNHFKVSWFRVDTMTLLTIHLHTVVRDYRISARHLDDRWQLHIRNVRARDGGAYACQVNTEPMREQVGYLEVLVPPRILDNESSPWLLDVTEGANVTLVCKAVGNPEPAVMWIRNEKDGLRTCEGPVLDISGISWQQRGDYYCSASNRVPPSASKRVRLEVEFAPRISVANPSVAAEPGSDVMLQCSVERFPKSDHYWTMETGRTSTDCDRYENETFESRFWTVMRLTIRHVSSGDYGVYRCTARNRLGEAEELVILHRGIERHTGWGHRVNAASRMKSCCSFQTSGDVIDDVESVVFGVQCLVMHLMMSFAVLKQVL